MGHEFIDDLRRRQREFPGAAHAEAGMPPKLDRKLRHLHRNRDAVDDRRAIDRVLV